MKTTRFFLLLLMLLATSGLNAQKEEDKYAALVSEVRNEVWSLNLPVSCWSAYVQRKNS